MVINYDRNPDLTADQKIQSLLESVQMALNEVQTQIARIEIEIKKINERE